MDMIHDVCVRRHVGPITHQARIRHQASTGLKVTYAMGHESGIYGTKNHVRDALTNQASTGLKVTYAHAHAFAPSLLLFQAHDDVLMMLSLV
jgi:hypothetical protein